MICEWEVDLCNGIGVDPCDWNESGSVNWHVTGAALLVPGLLCYENSEPKLKEFFSIVHLELSLEGVEKRESEGQRWEGTTEHGAMYVRT